MAEGKKCCEYHADGGYPAMPCFGGRGEAAGTGELGGCYHSIPTPGCPRCGKGQEIEPTQESAPEPFQFTPPRYDAVYQEGIKKLDQLAESRETAGEPTYFCSVCEVTHTFCPNCGWDIGAKLGAPTGGRNGRKDHIGAVHTGSADPGLHCNSALASGVAEPQTAREFLRTWRPKEIPVWCEMPVKETAEVMEDYASPWRERAESLERIMPSTFYPGRNPEFRIGLLVKSWQGVIKSNQRLETDLATVRAERDKLQTALDPENDIVLQEVRAALSQDGQKNCDSAGNIIQDGQKEEKKV